MQSRHNPYTFDPIDWHEYPFDESNYYDYDDWATDQAAERYEYLCGVVSDLEGMLDDQQVDYLSDLQLTPEDYRALDRIRNQTTEVHA